MIKTLFAGYNKFIIIGLMLLAGGGTYFFFNQKEETKKEKPEVEEKEDTKEEEEEEEITYPIELSLTTKQRMDLIKFLLENDVYALPYYENTNEIDTSVIAHKFINWDTNPALTEAQITYIVDNYEEMDDYAIHYLEKYIPYQEVGNYIKSLTGNTDAAKDSSFCMVYIEEYDFYVHIGGHGWRGGSVEYLSFGDEGGSTHLFYVEKITQINAEQYVFEISQYRLKPEHETLDTKTLLEKFILGEYNAFQAKIEMETNSYYLMKKDGDQWQFISHSETSPL